MVSELSAPGRDPASTVEAAAAGDTMAFARIVQAHHDDMARVCQVVTGDPDLAQDAAQAAWPIAGPGFEHSATRPSSGRGS